jgi:hypothetical protein
MTTTAKERYEVMTRLDQLGIAYHDACALRRIALTLHRWFELECGDSNSYGSWAIERDETTDIPYLVHHVFLHGHGRDTVTRTRLADREMGARKRLAMILAKYPHIHAYVHTDPRGAALHLLTQDQLDWYQQPIDCVYNQGVAVY